MRFEKNLVLLIMLGSVAWAQEAQTLTVLGDDPIDISSIAEGKNLQLGLRNNTENTLTLAFSFRTLTGDLIEEGSPPEGQSWEQLRGRGSQEYFPILITQKVHDATGSGYLVITATPEDGPEDPITIERKFSNTTFTLKWPALLALAAFPIVLLAWRLPVKCQNKNAKQGWIAGTPQVSFTESIGSLSTLFLAVSNTGLIPAISEITESSTHSLQVMGVLFALPIILAPMILRFSLTPVGAEEMACNDSESDTEAEEKTKTWVFVLASGLSLMGTLLQIYVLYEWLTLLDLSFLGPRLNIAIPIILALLIASLGFVTVRYALCNLQLCPKPLELQRGAKMFARFNTLSLDKLSADDMKELTQKDILVVPTSRPTRKLRNTLF